MGPRSYRDNITPRIKTAYSGRVTNGAVKRMKRCISILVQKSPRRYIWNPVAGKSHHFRIAFVTLTVADQSKKTDADVYRECLAPWLRWARRIGMKDYVWRAELQKRGAIHYHLATNVFMPWQPVRDTWNKYQKRFGYLQRFGREHGHFRPNSTDVHSVAKVHDIEAYMGKYMAKDTDQVIHGKIWDASVNLKRARYFVTELTPDNLDKVRSLATKEVALDKCSIFRVPGGHASKVLDSVQLREYQNFLKSI